MKSRGSAALFSPACLLPSTPSRCATRRLDKLLNESDVLVSDTGAGELVDPPSPAYPPFEYSHSPQPGESSACIGPLIGRTMVRRKRKRGNMKISEMNWAQVVRRTPRRRPRRILTLAAPRPPKGIFETQPRGPTPSGRKGSVDAAEPLGMPYFGIFPMVCTPYFLAIPGHASKPQGRDLCADTARHLSCRRHGFRKSCDRQRSWGGHQPAQSQRVGSRMAGLDNQECRVEL